MIPQTVPQVEPHDADPQRGSLNFAPQDRPFIDVCRKVVEDVLDSTPVTITMSIFTIWALFDNDIRLAGTSKDADLGFEVLISLIFFAFFFEIFAQCFCKPDYLYIPDFRRLPREPFFDSLSRRCQIGSFYFWLDLIATLSLILEV